MNIRIEPLWGNGFDKSDHSPGMKMIEERGRVGTLSIGALRYKHIYSCTETLTKNLQLTTKQAEESKEAMRRQHVESYHTQRCRNLRTDSKEEQERFHIDNTL
ncbi:hypothetical protein RSOLAG1IB_01155 [Rhizoctonia solani AG-1 IB]|uniref:Uncharacterized protein n=1 Tax=Thanatephorus cucumeris (strain AG1-IB / isolate 7/3/14) TaxID=1108050 RepID=A0A0B7FG25_THACB|nr:hypothetical protein RSOLAG1IB_01155 [Rhizoctonia solani AG-1 IB]